MHRFTPDPEHGEDLYFSQGTGFHASWQPGNDPHTCIGGEHNHTTNCEVNFAALEDAVEEGDLLTMEVMVATNARIRWNESETAITVVGCDGVVTTVQPAWLAAGAEVAVAD